MRRVLGWLPHLGRARTFHRIDIELFRRTTKVDSTLLDTILPRISRYASHSVLWAAIAALIAFLGGHRGRVAAARGMTAVGIASFLVNVPIKLLTRRKRPDIIGVPAVRRLVRQPTSTSFPSGHSASAFAFATGTVLSEGGYFAVPLLGLAGAVAYSRVFTGAHYPSDVVVGAALGTAAGVAVQKLWSDHEAPKGRRDEPPIEHIHTDPVRLTIFVNPESGGSNDGADTLSAKLPDARFLELDDGPLSGAASDADILGVSGGDGSVNAVARAALATRRPLAVFPGGTLNHFARTLGLNDTNDGIDAFLEGSATRTDVARIADRPFLNTASFGAYTELVDFRESLDKKVGKWPAMMIATVRALRRYEPIDVTIDGRKRRILLVFVGNSEYGTGAFAPASRERIDDGLLDIRLVRGDKYLARTRVLIGLLTGTIERSSVYERTLARGPVEVQSHDGPLRLAVDGETFDGPESFVIEKAERQLTVFAARKGKARRRRPRTPWPATTR